MADPRRRKIGYFLGVVRKQFEKMKLEEFMAQFNGTGRGMLEDACLVPSAMRSSIVVKSWFLPTMSSMQKPSSIIYKSF